MDEREANELCRAIIGAGTGIKCEYRDVPRWKTGESQWIFRITSPDFGGEEILAIWDLIERYEPEWNIFEDCGGVLIEVEI